MGTADVAVTVRGDSMGTRKVTKEFVETWLDQWVSRGARALDATNRDVLDYIAEHDPELIRLERKVRVAMIDVATYIKRRRESIR